MSSASNLLSKASSTEPQFSQSLGPQRITSVRVHTEVTRRPLHTLHTVITTVTIIGLGLITSVLLARYLGPNGRGEVAAVMLWPMLLTYISSTGLISATLYYAARPGARTDAIFANAMAAVGIQAIIAVTAGFLAMPWVLASQSAATT